MNKNNLRIKYKGEDKIINLKNRIINTNKNLDYTIIQILENDFTNDEINDFFEIDEPIIEEKNEYLGKDICIVQYPNGGELSFDQGTIESFKNDKIKHLVSTELGSSGSPILLKDTFKIIGIHKGGKEGKNNLGIFMRCILNDINKINNKKNEIKCIYNIKNIGNEQILNCCEETKRNFPFWKWNDIKAIENEKEIREKSNIYLNNKKINFSFKYNFEKKGNYVILMKYNNLLKNINFMFYGCSSLISLDLSNFNTINVNNMSGMFKKCGSLEKLDLCNFNTSNVVNM
jgi:surface protein